MKIRRKKAFIAIVSGSAVLLLTAIILLYNFTAGYHFVLNKQPKINPDLFNKDAVLAESQVLQDKSELIQSVEEFHPYLTVKGTGGYSNAKTAFLNSEIKTASDFYFAAAEFLAFFDDSQTSAVPLFDDIVSIDYPQHAYFDRDRWFVYPNGTDNEAAQIYSINGTRVETIVYKYFPSESISTMSLYFPYVFSREFMEKAGIELSSLTIMYRRTNGTYFSIEYPYVQGNKTPPTSSRPQTAKNFEVSTDDGVLYIKSHALNDDGSFNNALNAVKNAVRGGIKKAIFDVRGNLGGEVNYAKKILTALGFDQSVEGYAVKYSSASVKYKGTWHKNGYRVLQDFKYRNNNKNNIELKVFCDEQTSGAAMYVVKQCLYSGMGQLIGRIPAQNTNSFGDAIKLQLTNSKFVYTVAMSYSFYHRNGKLAADNVTVDVTAPAAKDIMSYVEWKT